MRPRKATCCVREEVATASTLAVGALALAMVGPWLADSVAAVARLAFRFDRHEIDAFTPGAMLGGAALAVLPPVAVLGLVVAGVTLAAQLLLGEGRFVPGNLAFKGSRINPLTGLKRMFGLNALIELGKGLLKVILLGADRVGLGGGQSCPACWDWVQSDIHAQIGLGLMPLPGLSACC
jgi:flagellar biosynthesis protein FlhB